LVRVRARVRVRVGVRVRVRVRVSRSRVLAPLVLEQRVADGPVHLRGSRG